VRRDARLIGQIDERRCIVTDHMPHRAALFLHRGGANPLRKIPSGLLLNQTRTQDAVRVSLHCHWPVTQIRQHRARDVFVILGKLALVDVVIGKEQLLRPSEMDGLPPDSQLFSCALSVHATPSSAPAPYVAPEPVAGSDPSVEAQGSALVVVPAVAAVRARALAVVELDSRCSPLAELPREP
jgi:hypothetical protein